MKYSMTVALEGNSITKLRENKLMRHIDGVIEANKAAGGMFFDKRTVLCFSKKVLPTMYRGKYFISYDLLKNEGKRFTVREVLPSGRIKTVGDRHGHNTLSSAKDAILSLLGMVTA